MENIANRLIKFQQSVSKEHGGRNKFEALIGMSAGYLSGMQKKPSPSIGSDVLEKVHELFPELNIEWLLTGNGSMLK